MVIETGMKTVKYVCPHLLPSPYVKSKDFVTIVNKPYHTKASKRYGDGDQRTLKIYVTSFIDESLRSFG